MLRRSSQAVPSLPPPPPQPQPTPTPRADSPRPRRDGRPDRPGPRHEGAFTCGAPAREAEAEQQQRRQAPRALRGEGGRHGVPAAAALPVSLSPRRRLARLGPAPHRPRAAAAAAAAAAEEASSGPERLCGRAGCCSCDGDQNHNRAAPNPRTGQASGADRQKKAGKPPQAAPFLLLLTHSLPHSLTGRTCRRQRGGKPARPRRALCGGRKEGRG